MVQPYVVVLKDCPQFRLEASDDDSRFPKFVVDSLELREFLLRDRSHCFGPSVGFSRLRNRDIYTLSQSEQQVDSCEPDVFNMRLARAAQVFGRVLPSQTKRLNLVTKVCYTLLPIVL